MYGKSVNVHVKVKSRGDLEGICGLASRGFIGIIGSNR
jgi:hypothetical protein